MMLFKSQDPKRDTGYTEFIGEPIIFQEYRFPRIPSLFCFADGLPGRRCMFLSNENREYTVSFEEGMNLMDIVQPSEAERKKDFISSECWIDDRYIHQLRTDPATRPGAGNFAYFHMKIPDENGEVHILPGQMTAKVDYQWSDEVERIVGTAHRHCRVQAERRWHIITMTNHTLFKE